jgi:putative glutamine amidotransferase
MQKVLLVNDNADMGRDYHSPFAFLGDKTNDPSLLETDPDRIALVVFTGGSDVSPSLYGQKQGSKTHCHPERDRNEVEIYQLAKKHQIPMFGICRGLQFLTVMNNGTLVQHMTGHHAPHLMVTKNGMEFEVSSSHHQMAIPHENYEVLAWGSPNLSRVYLDGNNDGIPIKLEVEAVKFENAVGVQYHPEIMPADSNGFLYVKELVEKYLVW